MIYIIDVNIYSNQMVEKSKLDNLLINNIKKDLTFASSDYISDEAILTYFFKENDKYIFLPRNYKIRSNDYKFNYIDNTTSGENINIKFTGKLRDIIQEQSSDFLYNSRYGILQLPPGKGKTVVCIHAICRLKKKTLIIIDREKLLTQWVQRILEFTNIKEEDIGYYNADKKELDKPIVIAMVQSLLSNIKKDTKQLSKDFYNANFGNTIIDEAHSVIGPEKITDISSLFFSNRILGLTATPDRGDETTKLLYYWFSNNIFSYKQYDLEPTIKTYFFNSKLRNSKTNRYICWGGKFNLIKYNSMLAKQEIYINTVSDFIYKAYKKNRFPIILSQLKKLLDNIKIKLLSDDYDIPEEDIGYFVGGSNEEEKNKKIVLSTFQMTSKGIDNKNWDTMFLLSSFSKESLIEQAVGRILRQKTDKEEPFVLDFVDVDYQILINIYRKRYRLYKKLNFNVKNYVGYNVNEDVVDGIINYIRR